MRTSLVKGLTKLAIWGAGYIGYSDAAFFAKQGVASTLMDIDAEKVRKIRDGEPPYPELATWLGFDVAHVAPLIDATCSPHLLLSPTYEVHLIAVNTEKHDVPYLEALETVCDLIAQSSAKLVIIESTMAPGWTDQVVIPRLPHIPVVVAPRRDWFTLPGMSLETLHRVIGGTTPDGVAEAENVLGLVSHHLHVASTYRVAELVKATENAYRHQCIALAYELTWAFPDVNIREVLQLAGTKWNMDTYFPSIGIGGYCIPLAPQYLLSGSNHPRELSLLRNAIQVDEAMPQLITTALQQAGVHSVCILGVSYKGNLKVSIASPSLRLAKTFMQNHIDTYVQDPLYTASELEALGVSPTSFPDMHDCDCVIVACDHCQYQAISKQELLQHLQTHHCTRILDCTGFWGNLRDDFHQLGIIYHQVGEAGWL